MGLADSQVDDFAALQLKMTILVVQAFLVAGANGCLLCRATLPQ
jgi:hypothetical protein